MSTKDIASSLFPKTRLLIFRELVKAEDEAVHLRELARRIGLDPSGVMRELRNLAASGIVTESRSGCQVEYRLNRDNPVYPEIRTLMLKTAALADYLNSALKPFARNIKLAYIYGSFADGTADAKSDVDLMVVGSIGLMKLAGILNDLSTKLRREINPTTYSFKEYEEQLAEKGSFIERVHKAPKIMLIGEINDAR